MSWDAVIIGSGPNGLSAGIALAEAGAKVLILESAGAVGGGTRTAELTLPGFYHDVCSAVHPTGVLSPYWKKLPLADYGLEWVYPEASVAHPLEDAPAVILSKSLEATADSLGKDGKAWKKLIQPFLPHAEDLIQDSLKPLGVPKRPIELARFGLNAMLPAATLASLRFQTERGQALLAGNAGHSVLPLGKPFSAAIGLLFSVMAHMVDWPVVKGGTMQLSQALLAHFQQLGGTVQTQHMVASWEDIPAAKVYLFNTDPLQLAHIAADKLPKGYRRRLEKFRYGPGAFKLDWALSESIPWKDPACLKASTVHIGGTLQEIAQSERDAWQGTHTERPYLILCQQSEIDSSRAPEGKHTGYAYCHVPHGSKRDMTEAIENQVERFAPGFKDIILARYKTGPEAWHTYNPNNVGGVITGGAAHLPQLFTRPVARWNPYTTPNRQIFLCSAATPPGGGVHGMCGFYAAQAALKRLG
ncbi:MAG: NAD(P)/FAD-dependent oxidoreductase [Bacteroidota bacterium]